MSSLDMVALRPFTYPYGTRDLKPGDAFRAVTSTDASALQITGMARSQTGNDIQQDAEDARARRQYRRRDMTAQK